ncbi:hypothetical protein O181_036389 [Austropuccinia psidii MF-1]|uniref:Uncharacterized protein n=1 Tax=Austropuccinia psidii MF-1 TaxID=1389203 RepID=A0A9Q3HBI1_9BASI|nr:hypothetical protein [Austropuccinia psidii MF-1]
MESSDYYQDPMEDNRVEYQVEPHLEIQDIQLEAGLPQDTTKKNLCKHTQDAHTFLVIQLKGMEYIHLRGTNKTVCVDSIQHPLIIDSRENSSIGANEYL